MNEGKSDRRGVLTFEILQNKRRLMGDVYRVSSVNYLHTTY